MPNSDNSLLTLCELRCFQRLIIWPNFSTFSPGQKKAHSKYKSNSPAKFQIPASNRGSARTSQKETEGGCLFFGNISKTYFSPTSFSKMTELFQLNLKNSLRQTSGKVWQRHKEMKTGSCNGNCQATLTIGGLSTPHIIIYTFIMTIKNCVQCIYAEFVESSILRIS